MQLGWLSLLTFCIPLSVGASTIGLYSDEACNSCSLSIGPGQSRTFYVRFTDPGGRIPLLGADFKVVGVPLTWIASVEPNPQASAVVGDLLNGGAQIYFSTAQSQGCLELYRVTVHATTAVENVVLQVAASDSPYWPGEDCPLIIYPSPPDPPILCAIPGVLHINGSSGCTVSVQPSTWGGVKRLYGAAG